MFMSYHKKDTFDIVKIRHDFTASDAEKIKGEFDYIICRGKAKLIIDLSELETIDQSAIELLFYCAEKTKKMHGGLVIYKPSESVISMFRVAQFKKSLRVYFSTKSATQALA